MHTPWVDHCSILTLLDTLLDSLELLPIVELVEAVELDNAFEVTPVEVEVVSVE